MYEVFIKFFYYQFLLSSVVDNTECVKGLIQDD